MKVLWTMFKGLFSYWKFEDKEEFWDWYWYEQIPDKRYWGENLYEVWDTLKWTLTLGSLRADIRDAWNLKYAERHYGYSKTFEKEGYFFQSGGHWLFAPSDKSFQYGVPSYGDIEDTMGE